MPGGGGGFGVHTRQCAAWQGYCSEAGWLLDEAGGEQVPTCVTGQWDDTMRNMHYQKKSLNGQKVKIEQREKYKDQ